MSKIKKIFEIIKVLSKSPELLLRVLDEETDKRDYVIKKYGFFQGMPVVDLLSLFPDFSETVEPYSFLEGTSMLTDLALLKSLVRMHDECEYLEIGTWRGESVANVAKIAKNCVSLSLSDEEMRRFGFGEDIIKNSMYFSKNISNIQHIGHDSRTFDFSKLDKKFDVIFIDGDHHYETVKMDTQNAFRLLKDENSVLVWHDYGFGPETIRWSVLAGILDGSPKDRLSSIYHISNTMCAVYMRGNFETRYMKGSNIPNKSFKVEISAKGLKNID
jgi:predicted O-methyltransferase YrrM